MRSKIVGTSKLFWAEGALERCRVFLDALFRSRSRWTTRISKFEDVIAVGDGRGRRAARWGSRCGGGVSGAGSTMGITRVVWRERSMPLVNL